MKTLPLLIGIVTLCSMSCLREDERFFGNTRPKHGPKVLWTNLSTEPEYIDPGKCSESAGGTLVFNLFAGLVQIHPQTLEPRPDIAESWEVLDDGRRYRFTLRSSEWSDGEPFEADDFVYSWRRVLDPATASKYASFLFTLENGQAFNQRAIRVDGIDLLPELPTPDDEPAEDLLSAGAPSPSASAGAKQAMERGEEFYRKGIVKLLGDIPVREIAFTDWPENAALVYVDGSGATSLATEENRALNRKRALEKLDGSVLGKAQLSARLTTAEDVGVRANGPQELEVVLEQPVPFFLDQLAFYTTRPVPRHVIERLKHEGKNPELWTRPEHIVVNGAFTIADAEFRQYYRLKRNERYWDAEHVALDEVRLLLVESYNTSLNIYRAGDVDWIGTNQRLPNEFIPYLRNYDDLWTYPYLGVYWYWLNTKAEPTSDKRVRQALSKAIDREALTRYIQVGGETPATGVVPDGLGGYEAPSESLFDPETARKLLADAGYPNGAGFPEMSLIYNTSESHKQIAEAIHQMWKKHLNIEVLIENMEWKVYQKKLQAMDFQVARMGWIGDYPDPYTFLEVASQFSGNNHSNWKSDEFDEILVEMNATLNKSDRLELVRKAEQIILDELPMLPIYIYARVDLVKPYVRGYYANLQNRHPYKFMSIDERWYDQKEGYPKGPKESPAPILPEAP